MENIIINKNYEVIKSSSSLRKKPSNNSVLETECLFGESLTIIKITDDWVYCKLLIDNYIGWIKKKNIGKLATHNSRVIVPRSFLYTNPNAKSDVIFGLSLGCKIVSSKHNNCWSKVYLDLNNPINIGYIPSNHIVKSNQRHADWVEIAESLINTPYKWGGRDLLGIDCSALVQLSLETRGLMVPRNTSLQKHILYPVVNNLEDIDRGMLIFWDGHVAISINKKYLIHANAYHMKTVIEPITIAKNRIAEKYGDIKIILDLRNI